MSHVSISHVTATIGGPPGDFGEDIAAVILYFVLSLISLVSMCVCKRERERECVWEKEIEKKMNVWVCAQT